MTDRNLRVSAEASFATEDPFVVGAIDNGAALLDAMDHLEAVRIDRYVDQYPTGPVRPSSALHVILARHNADARARLDRLRGLRGWRRDRAA